MQIKIRSNAFETNSSSMHSIVINSDPFIKESEDRYLNLDEVLSNFDDYDVSPDEDGSIDLNKIDIDRRQFGLENCIYDDFVSKLLYALGSYIFRSEFINEILNEIKNRIGLTIKYQTIEINKNFNFHEFFISIDHESTDVLDNFICDSKKSIMEFIFNPNIILVTNSDGG